MANKAKKTFRIYGRVIAHKTRRGVAGLRVEAWDKDLICDDLVGSAVTDERGTFQIKFDESHFRELFLDRRPDLYFKVFRKDELLKSTEDSVLWNIKAEETKIVIEVDVPLAERQKRPMVQVAVYDYKSNPLSNARVTLKPLGEKPSKVINLKFDKQWQVYGASDINPGNYLLQTEAEGFESDQRKVQVDPAGLREKFILGKKGMPFYYRGKVKVPFEPPRNLLGVSVKPNLSGKQEEELLAYARELKLQPEEVGEPIREDNVRVFRFPSRTSEQDKGKIQQHLSEHPLVRLVGPVIRIDKESVSFLTKELIVKFKPEITEEAIFGIVKRFNLIIIRKIPYSNNAFLLQSPSRASYDLLKVCDEIVRTGDVRYAEPNLVTTVVDLQVQPNDFLVPEQWHLPLVNLPDAWQVLRNANQAGVVLGGAGDHTFGSEDIIIAVMDRGIQSQTVGGVTTAAHADFNGTVTSGDDKVYQFFDFANMVADNDNPPNNHGMGCAGVASAMVDNPSVIPGVTEGVGGAAPNCRVMGLIRPSGGTVQQYADAYVWIAGFDPGWVVDGVNYFPGTVFPPTPIPGADIISNSFIIPDDQLIEDAFDFITTYGRNGKGIPNFCAAGNGNINVVNDNPMAAYEKAITVAASTSNEDKAWYSAFGNDIDLCAPSSGVLGIWSCDLVGEGNVPGHPTQQTTLSAAAAVGDATLNVTSSVGFVAGQAALVGPPGGVGTEACQVTGIPSGTQITVVPLQNAHAAGTAVITGPNDYRDNFGGTSSATPLIAGIAALMLSINPDLTWVQVRQILRDTAFMIDAANTDPVGQWVDTDGDGVDDFSPWYGYGRVDALAAVQEAENLVGVNPLAHIDTWIRENSADVGDVPSLPPYSPDVWVRNVDPDNDDPAQVNQHQSPIRGQDNWVYANVRNRGAVDSHDVYVRISITRWAGTQYIYPDDFIPTVPPSTNPIQPLAPGTYLIGEVHIDSIPAGGVVTRNTIWPAALVPPASVVIDGVTYSWADACLLVNVSPHDGPMPTGNHTWDNNNICQKNVFPVDPGDSDGFAIGFVVGHYKNYANLLNLRIERKNLPAEVKLYFDYIDEGHTKEVIRFLDELREGPYMLDTCDLTILTEAKGEIHFSKTGEISPVIIAPNTRLTLPCCNLMGKPTNYQLNPVLKGAKTVFAVPTAQNTYVPVPRRRGAYQVVALLGKGLRNLKKGEYQIDVYQEDLTGKIDGGVNFIIRKK